MKRQKKKSKNEVDSSHSSNESAVTSSSNSSPKSSSESSSKISQTSEVNKDYNVLEIIRMKITKMKFPLKFSFQNPENRKPFCLVGIAYTLIEHNEKSFAGLNEFKFKTKG